MESASIAYTYVVDKIAAHPQAALWTAVVLIVAAVVLL